MAETERQKCDRRLAELKRVRSSWDPHWREICDQILPYRARWSVKDLNRGERFSSNIINSTPTRSLRTMAAGLVAGITSPSRIWFHLTTADKSLNDIHRVREYLDGCERILREMLAQSRFYQTLADGIYRDLGMIATAAAFEEEDPQTGVRFETTTIGEYYLDVDKNGRVDTIFRERPMTVRQIVQEFGIEAVSSEVRNAYQKGEMDISVVVVHAVFPNEDWKPSQADRDGKRFASRWWEVNSSDGRFLRTGGYEEFPAMCPRWNVRAGEVYGRGSPGWESKGDCKALQHIEARLARLLDKTSDPPMRASDALRQQRASLLPGDVTYVPGTGGHMYEPAMQVPPAAIEATLKHIERHEKRIEEAFFVDLWMALLNDTRQQRATATEIEETRQEVMLQLGPLLENLNNDLLEPAITRTYAIAERQGRLPRPPRELQGTEGMVRVEFISVMHQAQKMTGIVGIRELVNQVAVLAQAGKPEALDKINVDAIVDELADMLGIKPELVYADEEVEAIRAAKAERQQAMDQGQAMLAATEGAKNLGQTDAQNLEEMATLISPVAAAQGGFR